MGAVFNGAAYLSGGGTLGRQAQGAISFLVKSTTDNGNEVLSFRGATSSFWRLRLGDDGVDGLLAGELIALETNPPGGFDAGTSKRIAYTTATRTELFDGNWHHVLVVANGTEYLIFLDGVSKSVTVGNGNNDGEFTTFIGTLQNIDIGGDNTAGRFFTGSLAEVAIWGGSGVENMGQAEADRLANGIRPTQIGTFADRLVLFDDFAAGVNHALWHRGPSLTNNGATFDVDDHPRVVVPPWPYAQAS